MTKDESARGGCRRRARYATLFFSPVLLIPKLNTNSHHNTFSTVSQGWTINPVLSFESAVFNNEQACSFVRDFLGAPRLLRCALDMAALIRLSCEPPMLASKVFEVVVQKNLQSTTPFRPPLPAFTEDARTSAKSPTTTSISALKGLPGSAFGASN